MKYIARRSTVFLGVFSAAIIVASACGAMAQDSGQDQSPKVENIEKRLEPLNPNVRDVTPKGVYRGQDWRSDQVERLPARPYQEANPSSKPEEGNSGDETKNAQANQDGGGKPSAIIADGKPVYWARPRVLSGGSVLSPGTFDKQYGEAAITFSGINPLAVDATCQGAENGQKWNCGRFAKGALALLLQGRSISCLPVKEKSKKITTRCEVAGRDISLWMVRHGWAQPAGSITDAKFKQQMDEALNYAKTNKKGIWLVTPPSL